ncbi:MAG TPA: phage protein Gp36 family protein [Polyangiaceae bacterium]
MPLPTPYLDLAGFTLRTIMPSGDVTLVETAAPGFIEARIAIAQQEIDSRLRKRYVIPLPAPVNEKVLSWITDLVTWDAFNKRGRNPSSPEMQDVKDARDLVYTQVKEAADSQNGLYDLPLRQDAEDESGIATGGPLGTAQRSVYTFIDEDCWP